MEVLIVGAGAMGRWFAAAVDADVAFVDVDADAATAAADAVGGRGLEPDDGGPLEPADDAFDAVCLAVPMGAVESALERYAPLSDRAVLDVTGEMATPLAAMAEHAPDLERISLHPLFAPDRAPGQIAAVRDEPGPTTAAILEDLESAGNEIVETTAAEHDEAMESVQAGAHAAILAFALAADPAPEGFETPVYAGIRRLVRRVTEGEPRVYGDIQRTFDGADAVAEAAARIADADDEAFEALHSEAAATWVEDESDGTAVGATSGVDADAEQREGDADEPARGDPS